MTCLDRTSRRDDFYWPNQPPSTLHSFTKPWNINLVYQTIFSKSPGGPGVGSTFFFVLYSPQFRFDYATWMEVLVLVYMWVLLTRISSVRVSGRQWRFPETRANKWWIMNEWVGQERGSSAWLNKRVLPQTNERTSSEQLTNHRIKKQERKPQRDSESLSNAEGGNKARSDRTMMKMHGGDRDPINILPNIHSGEIERFASSSFEVLNEGRKSEYNFKRSYRGVSTAHYLDSKPIIWRGNWFPTV